MLFKDQCINGYRSTTMKFEAFAEEWFTEYAARNLRHTTYERMKKLRQRTYE